MRYFCVLDLETTGLDPENDRILEIAWLVVDEDLLALGPSRSFVVDHGNEWGDVFSLLRQNDVVREMHVKSGLVADMMGDNPTLMSYIVEELSSELNNIGQSDPEAVFHFMGLSIEFDREFLRHHEMFRPWVDKAFHHRLLNLSSVKLMLDIAGVPWEKPVNPAPHRANADVLETLGQAVAFKLLLQEVTV